MSQDGVNITERPISLRFKRDGAIKLDGIRVGWIIRNDDYGPVSWHIQLTPASGKAGRIAGGHSRLSDAKEAARKALRG